MNLKNGHLLLLLWALTASAFDFRRRGQIPAEYRFVPPSLNDCNDRENQTNDFYCENPEFYPEWLNDRIIAEEMTPDDYALAPHPQSDFHFPSSIDEESDEENDVPPVYDSDEEEYPEVAWRTGGGNQRREHSKISFHVPDFIQRISHVWQTTATTATTTTTTTVSTATPATTSEPEKRPLCYSRMKRIYPKIGKNLKKVERFLLNGENYKQEVKVEHCIKPGHPCSLMDGKDLSAAFGIQTECVQKMAQYQLYTINMETLKKERDKFIFPSSCVCHQINQKSYEGIMTTPENIKTGENINPDSTTNVGEETLERATESP